MTLKTMGNGRGREIEEKKPDKHEEMTIIVSNTEEQEGEWEKEREKGEKLKENQFEPKNDALVKGHLDGKH